MISVVRVFSAEKFSRLVSAIAEKQPFSKLEKLLDDVTAGRLGDRMPMLKMVYCLAQNYLCTEDFMAVFGYIRSSGINVRFFSGYTSQESDIYWLHVYSKGNEEKKKHALENMRFDYLGEADVVFYIFPHILLGDKEVYRKIFSRYKEFRYRNLQMIFTAVALMRIDGFFDVMAELNMEIDTACAAALAIDHNDVFCNYIADKYGELLSGLFFDKNGKVLPLNRLVPVLFDSIWESDDGRLSLIGIAGKLSEYVSEEGLEKITPLIPLICELSQDDLRRIEWNSEIEKIFLSRMGDVVYIFAEDCWSNDFFNLADVVKNFRKSNDDVVFVIESPDFAFNCTEAMRETYYGIFRNRKNILAFKADDVERALDAVAACGTEKCVKAAITAGLINGDQL